MTSSFANIARSSAGTRAPVLSVKVATPMAVVDKTKCTECSKPRFSKESMCFDCLSRVGSRCTNYSDCKSYRSSKTSKLCTKCTDKEKSKCERFASCGRYTTVNSATKTNFKLCVGCNHELKSRCANFQTCGNRVSVQKWPSPDDPLITETSYSYFCRECETYPRCVNFAKCAGRLPKRPISFFTENATDALLTRLSFWQNLDTKLYFTVTYKKIINTN